MVLRGEGPGNEAIQHGAQGGGAWGQGYPAWRSGGRGLGTRLSSMVLKALLFSLLLSAPYYAVRLHSYIKQ